MAGNYVYGQNSLQITIGGERLVLDVVGELTFTPAQRMVETTETTMNGRDLNTEKFMSSELTLTSAIDDNYLRFLELHNQGVCSFNLYVNMARRCDTDSGSETRFIIMNNAQMIGQVSESSNGQVSNIAVKASFSDTVNNVYSSL